jgi:hypothetical protein
MRSLYTVASVGALLAGDAVVGVALAISRADLVAAANAR